MDHIQQDKSRKAIGNMCHKVDNHRVWNENQNEAKIVKSDHTKGHQCKICGLVNNNAWGLTIHMRRHNSERKAKCDQCPSSFVNNYELSKHMNSEHIKEKKYKCRFCPRNFVNPGSKYYHEDTHGILKHKCKFCEEEFPTQSRRRAHQRAAHRTGDHCCKYCLRDFSSEEFLNNHIATSHIKTVSCSECDKLFYDKKELQDHKKEFHKVVCALQQNHKQRKKHQLQKCNERSLYEDVDLNVKTYVFHCGICLQEFNFKVDLNSHLKSVHPDEVDSVYKFSCTVCQKSFDTKNKLRGHMIGHGPKNHVCPHCDYKTARDQDLEKHIRVKHDMEKQFKCTMCSKSFIHRCTFIAHKMKHAKTQFKCDMCDNTFSMKGQLAQHKKIKHYIERTICDQCGKQFMNPLSLKGHLRIFHNKQNTPCMCNNCGKIVVMEDIANHVIICFKQYFEVENKLSMKGPTCPHCNVTFPTRSDVLYHYKELHPDLIFSCQYCSINYLSAEMLKKHEMNHELKRRPRKRIHRKIFTIDEKRTMKSLNVFNDDDNIYECFACGSSFSASEDLNIHLADGYCVSVSEEIASNKTSIHGECYQKDRFIMYKILKDQPCLRGEIINEFFVNILPLPHFSEPLYNTINYKTLENEKRYVLKLKTSRKSNKESQVKIKKEKVVNSSATISRINNTHTKLKAPWPTSLEDLVKQEIIGIDKDLVIQDNRINAVVSRHKTQPNEKIRINETSPKITKNNVVTAKQLIELLQQKTVSVGGSEFLPFNELIDKLGLFSGIAVRE